ncbi:hypothetical protein SKAU_G00154770 [Synaphobranchus kaupii]|uniref:Uncharacterized protein n=1 Tax=Synaphobranchus kaupii TaxID=118154 RepID=A0A9Q1IZB2_SYNKA|nr:hypothetical protein SKAU_G00154770 [Synaphobranchus kaupii]
MKSRCELRWRDVAVPTPFRHILSLHRQTQYRRALSIINDRGKPGYQNARRRCPGATGVLETANGNDRPSDGVCLPGPQTTVASTQKIRTEEMEPFISCPRTAAVLSPTKGRLVFSGLQMGRANIRTVPLCD